MRIIYKSNSPQVRKSGSSYSNCQTYLKTGPLLGIDDKAAHDDDSRLERYVHQGRVVPGKRVCNLLKIDLSHCNVKKESVTGNVQSFRGLPLSTRLPGYRSVARTRARPRVEITSLHGYPLYRRLSFESCGAFPKMILTAC